MNMAEFEDQMDRLASEYGDKHYSAERRRLIWKSIMNFSPSHLERAIDSLVADREKAPLKSPILEALANTRGGEGYSNDHKVDENCHKCYGSGDFVAVLMEPCTVWNPETKCMDIPALHPHTYAFRCPYCVSAEVLGLSKSTPLFSDGFLKAGFKFPTGKEVTTIIKSEFEIENKNYNKDEKIDYEEALSF